VKKTEGKCQTSAPSIVCLVWTLFFAKVSNLLFIRRITDRAQMGIHYTIYLLFFILSLWTIVTSMMVIFSCRPIAATWSLELRLGNAKCINQEKLSITSSSIVIVMDVAFLSLAAWAASTLNISKQTKIAITFLFALGFLTIVACVGKMIALAEVYSSKDSSCKFLAG
jgi:uncharacterized membrane protein (DUF485 family)